MFFLFIEVFDHARIFGTILADIPLGIIFGFCLYLVISEKVYTDRFSYFALMLGITALLLTKQVGVAYVLVVLAMYFVLFLQYRQIEKQKGIYKLFLLIVIPFTFFWLWNSYVAGCNITDIRASGDEIGQFDLSKISIKEYLTAVSAEDGLRHKTLQNLIKAFFVKDLSTLKWIPLSYVTAFAGVLIWLTVLHRKNQKQSSIKKTASMGTICFTATVGYAFLLSVLYLFCFTTDEMEELRGYDRYVCSLILGEFLSLAMLSIKLTFDNKEHRTTKQRIKSAAIQIITLVTIMTMSDSYYFAPERSRIIKLQPITDEEQNVLEEKTEPATRITLIYDANNNSSGIKWYGGIQSYLQYYLNDRKLLWGADLYALDYSDPAQMDIAEKQIRNSDYLYFISINENLKHSYKNMTDNGELQPNTVYRVEKSEEEIKLVLK